MCYIYRQRGRKNPRPRCVDRVKNPPRVAAAPLVGPGKGRHTILCGLGYTYAKDNPTLCTSLNLIQHNTSNNNDETIQYLFFNCHVAKAIWQIINIATGIPKPNSIRHILAGWITAIRAKEKHLILVGVPKKHLILVGVPAMFWSIWLCRNDIAFDKNSMVSLVQVIFRGTY
jgi:hypothetical protein